MAQSYPRKTLSVFGAGGTTDDFEEFGSTAVAATNYTKDIATIQGLAAWTNGWRPALVTAKAPILQDMNAVQYVHSYMQGSLFEEGIPEYDSGTTYSWGSVVKLPYTGGNNFQIFVSLADGNSGNALPTAPASNSKWQFVYGFISGVFTMGTSIAFGSTSTQGIVGTATNDSAATGNVGEAVRSLSTPASIATNSTFQNVATISLTAGDWDVDAQFVFGLNGSTCTGAYGAISLFSGSTETDHVLGDNVLLTLPPVTASGTSICIAGYRLSLASTTTVYQKAKAIFSAGNPQLAAGRISARRVR